MDAASALFSESTGRVIVTVPREDDVKFRGLCEGRGLPGAAHRRDRRPRRVPMGHARPPARGARRAALEVQGLFTVPLAELRDLSTVDAARRLRADRRREPSERTPTVD